MIEKAKTAESPVGVPNSANPERGKVFHEFVVHVCTSHPWDNNYYEGEKTAEGVLMQIESFDPGDFLETIIETIENGRRDDLIELKVVTRVFETSGTLVGKSTRDLKEEL